MENKEESEPSGMNAAFSCGSAENVVFNMSSKSADCMKNVATPPARLFMTNSAAEAHEIVQNFAEETMTTFVSMRKMKQFGVTGE